jgi:ketosteroid isomerase-like protein
MTTRVVIGGWLLTVSLAGVATAQAAEPPPAGGKDAAEIKSLIARYTRSVDAADTALASEIWANTDDVSFIHPMGHEHGWEAVKANIYEKLMGGLFSERKLEAHDIAVHAAPDAAWAEFYWDFTAKLRREGTTVTNHGRETQVYRRIDGRWRLVHVHYSGMPAARERPAP